MRQFILSFGLVLAVFVSVEPARAGLTFCNKMDVQHSFAVAYKSGRNFKSKGWWNIDPGKCVLAVGGDLKRRYYYFLAEATGRDFLDAEYDFCTTQVGFDITGDEDCTARGYDKKLFRRIDTGTKAKNFTLNLVPPDAGGGGSPAKRGGLFGIKE